MIKSSVAENIATVKDKNWLKWL